MEAHGQGHSKQKWAAPDKRKLWQCGTDGHFWVHQLHPEGLALCETFTAALCPTVTAKYREREGVQVFC